MKFHHLLLIALPAVLAAQAPAVRTVVGPPVIRLPHNIPTAVAADGAGNVYFAVAASRAVMHVAPRTGESKSVVAERPWHRPSGLALDAQGNLYVADPSGSRVYKVAGGVATAICGNGEQSYNGDGIPALKATLNSPTAVAVSPSGDVYIAEFSSHRVRKITNGIISTVIGPDHLSAPAGLVLDAAGALYVADMNTFRVLKLDDGKITTVAGTGEYGDAGDGGLATRATLRNPAGLAFDSAGRLYVSDIASNRIRVISNGRIAAVPTPGAELNWPRSIAIAGSTLYIADTNNALVRALPLEVSK
jgi:sugar lactone lactonase YvrE